MTELSKTIDTKWVSLSPGGYSRQCQGRWNGAWAWVLRCGDHEKRASGSVVSKSEYRMELTATINALKCLKFPCHVEIFTACEYLSNHARRLLQPKRSDEFVREVWYGKAKNADLWKDFQELSRTHRIEICWVGFRSNHRDSSAARGAARIASYC
jgi:ribonuclease HI